MNKNLDLKENFFLSPLYVDVPTVCSDFNEDHIVEKLLQNYCSFSNLKIPLFLSTSCF